MSSQLLSIHSNGPTLDVPSRRKRLRSILFLAAVILWIPFALTSQYRIHPLALSPVGMLILLGSAAALLYFFFRRWILSKSKRLGLNAAAILILLFTSAQAPLTAPTGWDMFSYSLSRMWSTPAWQAAVDIHPENGLTGFTTLYFQTVVPGYPITLVMEPNVSSTHMEAAAILSGPHYLPLQEAPPILHGIPEHSLPVTHIVFAVPSLADPATAQAALLPTLQYGCDLSCVSEVEFEINPVYAAKLTIESASLVTTFVKVPTLLSNSVELAKTASDLALDPAWNTASHIETQGVTNMDGINFAWYSNSTQVYSGSVLHGEWKIEGQRQIVISQSWDTANTLPPVPDFTGLNQPAWNAPDNSIFQQPNFGFPDTDPSILNPPNPDMDFSSPPDFQQPSLPDIGPPDFQQPSLPDIGPPDFNLPTLP